MEDYFGLFLTLSKKTLICILAAVIAGCATGASVAISAAVAKNENGKYIIVIDAGHGGSDGGMEGRIFGTRESDINLYISRMLCHYLKKNGYKVIMTRNADITLSDGKTQNKKLSEMKKRAEIINSAKPDLMVSIHQNSYPLSSVKGAQAFYSDGSETGRDAARIFQSSLNRALGGERKEKSADYYVLQCSPYPSVLVECGFLSNPEEEKLLRTPAYREKVAYALYAACVSYLEKTDEKVADNV